VCPKHRNSRRETAGWDRIDHQEVFVFVEMHGPEVPMTLPALFNFRGCDLTARMASRHGACPGAIPGNRTSLRQSMSGRTKAAAPKLEERRRAYV